MKFFYFLFILIILLTISACSDKPGEYDVLANCLTEKGAVMYGTEWCSHCQNQKKSFGKSFEYIDNLDEVDRLLNDLDSDKRILAFYTSIYLVESLINEPGLVNFFESMTKLSQSGQSFPNHLRNTQQCANTAKYFLPKIAQHVNGCESGKKGSSSRYLCMGAM